MKVLYVTAAFMMSVAGGAYASPASEEACRVIEGRITKYAELMDQMIFMDEDVILSNKSFSDFHKIHVTYEVLAGELERISEAKSAIENLCR